MTSEERRRVAAAKRYIEIMRSLDPTQFRPDFTQRIDEQEEEILTRERALDGHIPTTEEIRNNAVFGAAFTHKAMQTAKFGVFDWQEALQDNEWPEPGVRGAAEESFNRWLDERDREWIAVVKAEAWTEAVEALDRHHGDLTGLDRIVLDLEGRNPYRKEGG